MVLRYYSKADATLSFTTDREPRSMYESYVYAILVNASYINNVILCVNIVLLTYFIMQYVKVKIMTINIRI